MIAPLESSTLGCLALAPVLAVLALSCAPPMRAAQSATAPPARTITEITLERDCSGCPTGSTIVLRRNGTATHSLTGKARHGTTDRSAEGEVPSRDFDELARLLVSANFFELNDEYDDPTLVDGEWAIMTAIRDGERKTVLNRNHAGPETLATLERAIDALRVRIRLDASQR
jgi:hypothetical protein